MKFRTCLLAVAGVLGSAAIASAQPAPAPPPPPADADAGAAPTDPNAPPPAGTTAPVAPPPGTPAPTPAPADPNAPPGAQPPPAGAQPPAPAPAPTPAPAPAPAAQPTPAPAPAQPPAVTFGVGTGATGPDTANGEEPGAEKGPKPLIWRGTTFTFNQAGTTTIFGVGRDNIGGEGEFYGWDFSIKPNFYLYDAPKDKVTAFAEISWSTELTNSDTTTDIHDTLFNDAQIGVKYGRSIWESGGKEPGEYATSGSVTARFVLPTSNASATQGRYLVTALGVGAKQQIKILGKKADGLNNVSISPSLTWSHLFSRSFQPTDPSLDRQRQNATGDTLPNDDRLSGKAYDPNRITLGLAFGLPLYKDLTLSTSARLIGRFKHDFETGGGQDNCDIKIANDPCVVADRDPNRVTYSPTTAFDLSLSYPIYEVVDVTLGYSNESLAIGEDGQRRGIFYSPDAQFYLDLTANLDVIYSKVTKRDKKPSASQWAGR